MGIGVNANITSGDVHAPGATTVITLPTGTAATDVVTVFFGSGTSSTTVITTTPPTGWTAIATAFTVTSGGVQVRLSGYWALGNVASKTFTNTGAGASCDQGWICLGFTGVDNTTPIDAAGTTSSSTGASAVNANAVTVATDQAWEVIGLTSWQGGTWSASGFTAKQNAHVNEDASCLYNSTPKAVGSTGTVSCSSTGSSTGQVEAAMPFALRPTASAAPPEGWQEVESLASRLKRWENRNVIPY